MHQLGRDLDQVKDTQNKLIEVIEDHEKRLERINRTLHSMMAIIEINTHFNSIQLDMLLRKVEQDIYRQTQRITHAVQTAQMHRMSVDLLSAEQLKKLFKKLTLVAQKMNNQLLIDKPSDLFQLETTYLADDKDIQLLIHVPSVPKEGLLDLFQLHPFPLPLDGNHSLIPVVEDNVLALTSDYRKYHTQLSTTTLMGCQKLNTVYICERHGVLTKELNQTCVGALYLQDYDSAQKFCQIQVTPTKEIVFQLLGNWFLIYSPIIFTSDVYCANNTRSRFFIPVGVTKHHLSPGCYADFKDHVLFANTAVRIESDILHFEWQWENQFFQIHDPLELAQMVQEFQESGNSAPTLNEINHIRVNKKSGFRYLFHILSFIFSTIATSIVTILILYLVIRYRASFTECYTNCSTCGGRRQGKDILQPVGTEDQPLRELGSLPRYTSSYRTAANLYPPTD
jgi:hypothetical protein